MVTTGKLIRENRDIILATNSAIPNLAVSFPTTSDWKVYDHCSAVVRLCVIYESFVRRLAGIWLTALANTIPYTKLPECLRKQHQEGVATILIQSSRPQFKNLAIPDVILALHQGLTNAPYTLTPEAFMPKNDNLRLDVLLGTLSKLGIDVTQSWLTNHPELSAFVAAEFDTLGTPPTLIDKLVAYRNEAAHSQHIAEILGHAELLRFSSYILELVKSLADLTQLHFMQLKIQHAKVDPIATVTESFRQLTVVANVLPRTRSIGIGDKLVMVPKNGPKFVATVESIQIQDQDVSEVPSAFMGEVGLRCKYNHGFGDPANKIAANTTVYQYEN
jgi:hypothetical protein